MIRWNRTVVNMHKALHPKMNSGDQEVKFCVQVFASNDAIEMTLNLSYVVLDRDLKQWLDGTGR